MIIKSVEHSAFRNLQDGKFMPEEGINVIFGQNAQGKTNLIEALWLFTGGKSFRGSRDSEMIRLGADTARLTMNFNACGRERQCEITIPAASRRHAVLGGVTLASASQLTGTFAAVIFSPTHLSLVRDGPEIRRRFIDAAYCQLRPGYVKILGGYQRALSQRNALLRMCRENKITRSDTQTQLDAWDEQLARAGAQVYAARTAYIRRLSAPASEIYYNISGQRESMTLAHRTFAGGNASDAYAILADRLSSGRSADLAAGYTTAGPHRDDLEITIGDMDARHFGSQGQQRSAVLALKLAEAEVLVSVYGERPVILLDDVVSELDIMRQDYVLNRIKGGQVFVTCCDPVAVLRMTGGTAYKMDAGNLCPHTAEFTGNSQNKLTDASVENN